MDTTVSQLKRHVLEWGTSTINQCVVYRACYWGRRAAVKGANKRHQNHEAQQTCVYKCCDMVGNLSVLWEHVAAGRWLVLGQQPLVQAGRL